VREYLIKNFRPVKFRLRTLLEVLNRILSQQAFHERQSNELFSFKYNSPITPQIRSWFEFGSLPFSDANFSGQYFLIVEPHHDHDESLINSFKIFDNEDDLVYQHHIQYRIEVIKSIVDAESIQDYEQGNSEQIDRREMSVEITESPEHHKESILLVLTETIMSLLVDLTPATREALLGNGTLEEFVQQCNKKYNREFDLNFPALGIAGAHEIAWQEVFSDFDDQVWK
jgi:hypothetical protein